jgi:glutathione S-transferase
MLRRMTLKFYYAPMSTASITELILNELDVPCERIKLDIRAGETKKPEFLKINPNGKVPCLVHDGVAMWESAALTAYLGETFGVERKLYPAPGTKRGEALTWIAWTSVTLGDAVSRYTRNTQDWAPADQKNAAAGKAAADDIASCLKILDTHLTGKQFLLGAEYSVVDAHLCSFSDWLRHMKIDFTPFKSVNAWAARCADRPAYKKAMADAGM